MFPCPYAGEKFHRVDAQSCCIAPVQQRRQRDGVVPPNSDAVPPTLYKHVYYKARYSINPRNGTPLCKYLNENLQNIFDIHSYDININECTLTSVPYDPKKYVHALSYVAATVLEYWNIIYNFKDFWQNETKSLQTRLDQDEQPSSLPTSVWPCNYTVLDVLVDKNCSNKWKIMRPVTFTTSPTAYRRAIHHLMYTIFCNSLESPEIQRSDHRRRPRRMKCGKSCKMCVTASTPFYNIFGKGDLVHHVICTPEQNFNDEWWELTDAFIKYRWLSGEDDPSIDSIISGGENIVNHTSTTNKLKALCNRFKNSISRLEASKEEEEDYDDDEEYDDGGEPYEKYSK